MRNTIALITALAVILIAAPSLGKGPSSATISGPGIEEPIELLAYEDPQRTEAVKDLMTLTGVWFGGNGLPEATPEQPDVDLGPAYLLTWGPHGITQTLYLHAEGGPVVHTPEQQALRGWGNGVTGWVKMPSELLDTLRLLGVPVDAPAGNAWSIPPVVLVIIALAVGIAAASRFVNSRLRPVVSTR